MNTSSNPDCSNLFYAHLLALRTRSIPRSKSSVNSDFLNSPNLKLFYLRSINPTIEKINPTIPIPITSSPIPDEQREIIMAKSSIAIPNPIFFIVNPPLQMSICCHLHYTSLPIKKIAYFMKLVGWEQLATQGVPRWQVHKRVAGGSQRRGSVASPV